MSYTREDLVGTIKTSERIRCDLLFYGTDMDLKKLEQLVRESLTCPVEVIDGLSEFTVKDWEDTVSRTRGGCLLVTTEARDGFLSPNIRQGVIELLDHKDAQAPFVYLAVQLDTPSELDDFVIPKFKVARDLDVGPCRSLVPAL